MNKARIMVIDNDAGLLATIESIFKVYEPGYKVILLNDPKMAIGYLEREKPDVIITDWEMPGMNGLEIIQYVRKNREFDTIPIIMATGVMNNSENLMTALGSGANDFIMKPFDRIILIARTRSMVSLAYTLKNLQEQNSTILENNIFIRSLIQSIADPLVYYTIDGNIVGFNEGFRNHTGTMTGNLQGALIYRCCDVLNADIHFKMDMDLIANGSIKKYETMHQEEGIFLMHSKTLYYNALNKPEGIMYIITDVTEIRKTQDELLESKKRELMASGLRLIQISEMNNKLISDLKLIKQHTDNKGSELISTLITDYNSQYNSISRSEFESRFENVYESFYKRLKERFPELTSSEKKLCALLRLKMTSKEIAALTFQAPQSVDMARYRLRKKLRLPQSENLISYLELI
jgi:CheY-like chemotaxis protein